MLSNGLKEINRKMKKIILIFIALLIVSACDETIEKFPKFTKGQIVYSVLNDQKGQILIVRRDYDNSFVYNVRFAQNQSKTGTSIFGDGPIDETMYATFWMHEFELKENKK